MQLQLNRAEVLDAHRERFVSFAYRLTRNHADAEDAVQTASLNVLLCVHPLPDEMDVIRMMFRSIRNAAYSLHRAWGARRSQGELNLAVLRAESTAIDEQIDGRRCLEQLDPRDLAIFEEWFFEGRTGPEIGKRMGLEAGHVAVLLHRAKKKLKAAAA